MKVIVTYPIMTRYEIQIRSGAVWDWSCGMATLAEARREARSHRRYGYRVRIVDTRSQAVVK